MQFTKKYLGILIIIAAGIFSALIVAHAQDATTATPSADQGGGPTLRGITFPIPELGNCASKDECRAYCDDIAHMDACIAFAKAHGLMNGDDASRAEKFKAKLQSGGGPGGCKTPDECRAFCSNTANLEVCVKFAKDHGVKDGNVDQGEKILAYVKAGGQMPGGCDSKESCEKYCGDFSHAEECSQFAQKAGLAQRQGGEGSVPPSQFQKFLEIIKRGETPGGCKSKDECEVYCKDPAHRDECLTFAEKAGFIQHDQAEMIRKTGGKGPGGCDSQDACHAYCNDPAHQEECFKFAEEQGFMSHEETRQAKNGFVRLRAGLENAPEEVKSCLKSTLGEKVIDNIESGELVPGLEIGQQVKSCFEKFGGKGDPQEVFKHAPPQVLACLKEKLGDQFMQIQNGKTAPTPEIADTFRVCFQSVQFQGGFGRPQGPEGGGNGRVPSPEMIRHFLMTAPPEIQSCLKDKLGADFEKIQNGEQVQVDTSKLKSCFEQFKPRNFENRGVRGEGEPGPGVFQNNQSNFEFLRNVPPQVLECVKGKLGNDFARIQSGGEKPTPEIGQMIKSCFGQFAPQSGQVGQPPSEGSSITPVPPGFLPNQPSGSAIPPQYAACITSVLGDGGMDRLKQGQVTADQKTQIAKCVASSQGTGGSGQGQLPVRSVCEHAAPPQGCSYEGPDVPPACSAKLVCPNGFPSELFKAPTPPPPPVPSADAQHGSFFANILSTFAGFLRLLFH